MSKGSRPQWLPSRLLGGRFRDAEIIRYSLPYHVKRTIKRPIRTVLWAIIFTVFIVGLVAFVGDPEAALLLSEEGVTVAGVLALLPSTPIVVLLVILSFIAGLLAPISGGVRRDIKRRRVRR